MKQHISTCTVCKWRHTIDIRRLYANHRQLVRYEKNGLESAFGTKKTHILKILGFENVSSRAEVHSKICDQLIEA
jgi:hypothetical protein